MWESGAQPGDFLRICDICGKRCKASETRKTWDGLITCLADWDPKQPTLTIRATYDRQSAPEPRPEPPPAYVPIYGLGSFCLRSPNGTPYIVTVDDGGNRVVVSGALGTPVDVFTIYGFDITVSNNGTLSTVASAVPNVKIWRMASPSNYFYHVTIAPGGTWQLQQVSEW